MNAILKEEFSALENAHRLTRPMPTALTLHPHDLLDMLLNRRFGVEYQPVVDTLSEPERKLLTMLSFKPRQSVWCPILVALLGAALIAGLVFFGVIGRGTAPDAGSSNKRTRLPLTVAERDIVLGEMRGLLTSCQAILEAALANDLKRAAVAARAAGMGEVENIPLDIRGPLIGKLPLEFKQLGFSVHRDFDQIALDAESLGDRDHTLKQLAQLMQKCVACHAGYAIGTDEGKTGEK